MRALSSFLIGISLLSGFLLLALVAEIYYLFLRKKTALSRVIMEDCKNPASCLRYFCWKNPSSSTSTGLISQEICSPVSAPNGSESSCKEFCVPFGEEESVEAELMRLHHLSGPPRFLFTIKEETKEDLESEGGRSSRKGSRGGSLNDLLFNTAETPFLTPLPSPPFFTPSPTPVNWYSPHGLNPLFESSKYDDLCIKIRSSPPPKFKFLKDAEEKLYRRMLMEEALKAQRSNLKESSSVPSHPPATAEGVDAYCPSPSGDEDGSFIAIIVGKRREKGLQLLPHSISSQVIPMPSPPPFH